MLVYTHTRTHTHAHIDIFRIKMFLLLLYFHFYREQDRNQRLHEYLSTAFNIPLENGEIELIKSNKYVLTKDFAYKMLNIHERKECGMPVIIEGETGVGKTFLLEMLSLLWNHSWTKHIYHQRDIVIVSTVTHYYYMVLTFFI